MYEQLLQVELFRGLSAGKMTDLAALGRPRTLRPGEYLFLLGDSAEYLTVVLRGTVDLCFPISVAGAVKDISVETAGPGKTIGWSALVKPFRFTLSARAAESTEVTAFARHDLHRLFDSDHEVARIVLGGIAEIMANRLSMFQALWAREFQRSLEDKELGARG